MGTTSLGGGEVTGGRGFGVVSGEAVRQQREIQQDRMPQGIPADILQNIASGIQQQNNLPPGGQLPLQQPGQFPNQMSNQFPQQQPFVPQGQPMQQNVPINAQQTDIPQQRRANLASGAAPSNITDPQIGNQLGGTTVTSNPTASPTDAMVNRLAEAERAVKTERRSQWLNMNQSSASNVLANLGADLPSHLKDAQGITPAEVIAGAMGQPTQDGPNDALLRRMCEVASRRVARKAVWLSKLLKPTSWTVRLSLTSHMLMTDESLTRQTTSVQLLSMQYRPKLRSKASTWPLKLFSHA